MKTIKFAIAAGLLGFAGICGAADAANQKGLPDVLEDVHNYTVLSDGAMGGVSGQMLESGEMLKMLANEKMLDEKAFEIKRLIKGVLLPAQAYTGISKSPLFYLVRKSDGSVLIFPGVKRVKVVPK